MADDREVLRVVWDGRLPVCFNLSSDEVVTVEQPDPYYLLVPRLSYLTLVTDKVQRHFQRAIHNESVDEMWFEYDGQPLKWHYPIGVLFDLYGSSASLPWNLTVHFQKFPEGKIIRCPGKEAIESLFMSAVKEADNLKHRSQVINSMQMKDHKQLWLGLCNDKFEQFWAVNRRLMERTGDDPFFKFIPFRIFQSDYPNQFIQELYKPLRGNGEQGTLSDLLREFVPEVFSSSGGVVDTEWRVVIQGVEPPLETPVHWLSEHMSHPDNFLYIVIVHAA
ncbi:PREDICTED: autophagy protein 5-like [Acropora digitifera]|nr:PREDICTED: autophagy protein 5-like [Acropora digitifera]